MKSNLKYKFLASAVIVFIALLSLSFAFFVAKSRTDGNVAYWVFKAIALAWLVLEGLLVWFKSANVGRMFPTTITGIIAQFIPCLMRIGWYGDSPKVPVALIYVCAIVMFIMIVCAVLFSFSNSAFKAAEDRAKPSSNAKN